MKNISCAASAIAKRLSPDMSDEAIRDACDFATYGELDCFQLDMLTDAVTRRLRRLTLTPAA